MPSKKQASVKQPLKIFTPLQLASFVGMICLFILFRWNSFTTPFERDEGEYAYGAQLLTHHQMPYEHSFLQKPPMIVYAYLVGQFISEDSIVIPRIFASLSVLLTIALTGWIVAKESNNFIGLTTTWILVPLLSFPGLYPFAANTEVFMILPMMVTFFFFIWKKGEAPLLHWFLAGVSGAIACLFKPICALALVFIVFSWQWELWMTKKNFLLIVKHTLVNLAGVVITTIIVLLPFLLHDGGKTLKECVIDYNTLYASYTGFDYSPFLLIMNTFWHVWWILFLLLAWFIIKRPKHWLGYLGILGSCLFTIYHTPIYHYYILIVPFLAIIAGLSLDSLFKSFSFFQSKGVSAASLIVIGLIMLVLCIPNYDFVSYSPTELLNHVYGPQNTFLDAQIMAEHLTEVSKPTDKVYIAGSEPEIFYYTHRQSSNRFIIIYPLMIPTSIASQYQDEAIASLKNNPPDEFIYVHSEPSWMRHSKSPTQFSDFLQEFINKNYSIVGGVLGDEKEWVDRPSTTVYQRCSMALFKKKTEISSN